MASVEHDFGVILDEGKSVGMEVSKHGVAFPAAENPDLVRIDAAKEKSHGTTRAEGPSGDVVWFDAGITGYGKGGGMEQTSDHRAGNRPFTVCSVVVDV